MPKQVNGGAADLPTAFTTRDRAHFVPPDMARHSLWSLRAMANRAETRAARQAEQDPADEARSRWQQRMDNSQGDTVNDSQHTNPWSGRPVRGGGGGNAGYDVTSMRNDWTPALGRAKSTVEDFVAQMRAFAAARDDDPVHQSVKDAAAAIAAAAEPLVDRVEEVNGLTRQADATRWEIAEAPRPNDDRWTRD